MGRKEMTPTAKDQEVGLKTASEAGLTTPISWMSASPWQMMRRMQEDMDRMFGGFLTEPATYTETSMPVWSPSVDLAETDREYCIEAELPGVKQDDITVDIVDHQITIQARMSDEKEQREKERQYYRRERRSGCMARTLALPSNVNEEQISCDFKDGVLTCHVPKTEAPAAPKGRRVAIGEAKKASPTS